LRLYKKHRVAVASCELQLVESSCGPILIYNQFQEIYKLKTIQWQVGNSDKQQKFKDLLSQLYNEESTWSD